MDQNTRHLLEQILLKIADQETQIIELQESLKETQNALNVTFRLLQIYSPMTFNIETLTNSTISKAMLYFDKKDDIANVCGVNRRTVERRIKDFGLKPFEILDLNKLFNK